MEVQTFTHASLDESYVPNWGVFISVVSGDHPFTQSLSPLRSLFQRIPPFHPSLFFFSPLSLPPYDLFFTIYL